MIRRTLVALLALSLFAPTADAATKKPTPKPTVKSTVKAPVKATSKATAKPTVKATKKAVVKKKVVKRKPRKKVRVTPSPKPKWPPVGYSANGEVYAKVPSAKELVGILSAKKSLSNRIKDCEKFSCGAVQVASENGCLWWEVESKLIGATSAADDTRKVFGNLRTLVGSSDPKQILTILLISSEPLEDKHAISDISVTCHHDATDEKFPSNIYTRVG